MRHEINSITYHFSPTRLGNILKAVILMGGQVKVKWKMYRAEEYKLIDITMESI